MYLKQMETSVNPRASLPASVYFIITNEFCERFSYYGMRTVLALYLSTVLSFSESTATVIYHGFLTISYFTPLLGAMLADSVLGKFKTIFYLSMIYAIGSTILSVAAISTFQLPTVAVSMIGLALIALGTGGIKPCVSAFGGDQFILPQEMTQLTTFFSFFYAAINAGGLISTFLTPALRSNVKCFGDENCYSLAFGVPAALMIVSIVVFVAGKSLYREVKPKENVILKVAQCISHAVFKKLRTKKNRLHWLDHAEDKYDLEFIEDVKIVLRVLVLYLPLPLFWALFDQQGSRWTLQANRMDGSIGGYTITPDQIQALNPILILAFIPLFNKIIFPLLSKYKILRKPLQRMTVGGSLAGISFVISGVIELKLQKTKLHMMWLLPQYIALTAGEILFSVTGLEFSYSQAPVSMKSLMQSAWLMAVAVGNLIVMIIAEAQFFEEQSKEFFLFAGLMFVDMLAFGLLAKRYVPL